MAIEIRAKFEELRSLGFASIGAAYMGIGTALEHPARVAIIHNFTDKNLMFSIDGIKDELIFKADSSLVLDISTNKTIEAGWFFEKGTRLYVKEIDTPTEGSVYFSVLYGEQD